MAEWPPIVISAVPDPDGLDPLLSYPVLDPIISTEVVAADNAVSSPENRVVEYLSSRTETLRALANEVVQLLNLVGDHFLDRDGEQNVTNDPLRAATGLITLSGLPNDGDSVTLDNGHGTVVTFEFDSNSSVASGAVAVTIAGSAGATATALLTAINAHEIDIEATFGGAGIVRLTAELGGAHGNQPIVEVDTAGVIAVEGMSGGLDLNAENPAPSYMRGHLDLGGFRIRGLADATAPGDLVNFDQFKDVQFAGQDDVEQVLDGEIVRRDGTIQMAGSLDMGGFRIANCLNPPTASDHFQPKGDFDGRVTTFVTSYVNLLGNNSMTGDLSMQVSPSDPRYKVTNVGSPVSGSDVATREYTLAQFALLAPGFDIPVGTVVPFAGPLSEVTGPFLPCDGRQVSRTIYLDLFLVIGTLYGTPANVNVFKVPDLRGRVVMGLDNMPDQGPAGRVTAVEADSLGGKLGSETHALTVPQMASHSHTYDDAYGTSGAGGAESGADATDADNPSADQAAVTNVEGSGNGHPNVQPSRATHWLIRY